MVIVMAIITIHGESWSYGHQLMNVAIDPCIAIMLHKYASEHE